MAEVSNPGNLEERVGDRYIVRLPSAQPSNDADTGYQTLLGRAAELQEQHGEKQFIVYRKIEAIKAVDVIIRDSTLVDLLENEGYTVEKQAIIKADAKY